MSFPPSPPPSFPPRNSVMFNNELMADVHFMVGQPGRTQRLPGHRVRNFTKRRGGNYQKTAKTKQSRRWPGDNLPSAAAATTGLRNPLCAALTSTPRASSRRSSIINANEAEGAEGRGGEGDGEGGEEASSSVRRAAERVAITALLIRRVKPHPPAQQ